MITSRYLNIEELLELGFNKIGDNVKISNKINIAGKTSNISIGNNVRIDAFTTIIATGPLDLGSYIHIGEYCFLHAGNGIILEDFVGLSQGVRIYTGTDDYSGEFLTNPTVPRKFLGGRKGPVRLCRHVIIGSGSVIMPKLTIGIGSSVGALSFVTHSLQPWGVYSGVPSRKIKNRSQRLLILEYELLSTSPL